MSCTTYVAGVQDDLGWQVLRVTHETGPDGAIRATERRLIGRFADKAIAAAVAGALRQSLHVHLQVLRGRLEEFGPVEESYFPGRLTAAAQVPA